MMVMLLRVVKNMAKVLVIRGIKDTKMLISSRFASFFYALYFCHGPGEPNSLEFHLVKLWMKNMTERVDVRSPGKSCGVCFFK